VLCGLTRWDHIKTSLIIGNASTLSRPLNGDWWCGKPQAAAAEKALDDVPFPTPRWSRLCQIRVVHENRIDAEERRQAASFHM